MKKELSIREISSVSKNTIPAWVLRTYETLADSATDKTVLKFEVDATHSGRVTNGRVYPGKKMRAAAGSWYHKDNGGTAEYDKPVIKHHDEDKDPIGRVRKAKFIALKHNDEFNHDYKMPDEKGAGSGFLRLTIDILDKESIEKVLDGRLETVSTRQTTDGMYCTICDKKKNPMRFFFGEEEEEDACKHESGETYEIKNEAGKKEKKIARMYTGDLLYHEMSFVTIPGDTYAKIVRSSIVADAQQMFDSANDQDKNLVLNSTVVQNEKELMLHDFRILDALGNPIKAVEKKTMEIVSKPIKKEKEVEAVDKVVAKPVPAPSTIDTIVESPKVGPESEEKTLLNDNAPKEQENRRTETMDKQPTVASVSLSPEEAKTLLDNQVKLVQTLQTDLATKETQIKNLSETLSSREATIADLQSKIEAQLADASSGLAGMVVACHVLLDKRTVVGVSDKASYQSAVKEYAKRTLDSLKDSLNDSIAELLDKVIEKGSGGKKEKPTNVSANDIIADEKADQKPNVSDKKETTKPFDASYFDKLVDKYIKE